MSPREGKRLAQGHTADRRQEDSSRLCGCLAPSGPLGFEGATLFGGGAVATLILKLQAGLSKGLWGECIVSNGGRRAGDGPP